MNEKILEWLHENEEILSRDDGAPFVGFLFSLFKYASFDEMLNHAMLGFGYSTSESTSYNLEMDADCGHKVKGVEFFFRGELDEPIVPFRTFLLILERTALAYVDFYPTEKDILNKIAVIQSRYTI